MQKEYALIYLSYKRIIYIHPAVPMQIKILQTVVLYKIGKLNGQTPFKIWPCEENPQNKITF